MSGDDAADAALRLALLRDQRPIRHLSNMFTVIDQGDSMAKRSTRRKIREHQENGQANVHPLFPRPTEYDPREADARDRKYVKNIRAMGEVQQRLLDAIDECSVVAAVGPAGTGKTYLAIAKAVEAIEQGRVGRIVLTRPAVEAGESL